MPGSDPAADRADRGGLRPTRRGVLTAMAAFGVGTALESSSIEVTGAGGLASALPTVGDLVGADHYVEWGVDHRTAPLPTYLRESVAGFDPEDGAARAFLSDGTPDRPRFLETAVYPAADSWAAVGDATRSWFAGRTAGEVERERTSRTRAVWTAPAADGERVAVRLDRVEDRIGFTVAGGDPGARLDPRSATRRYGRFVRRRVERQ